MYPMRCNSVADAYEKLIPKIILNGIDMTTEDGQTCKELQNVIIEITNLDDNRVSTKYPLGKRAIDSYTEQLINGSSADFVYDYHGRLFEYPVNQHVVSFKNKIVEAAYGCNTKLTTDIVENIKPKVENFTTNDQIEYIVDKLKEQINSRRAVAITWDPAKDQIVKDVPCMQFIQFLVRDGEMTMTVLFRSNDANLAFHANALGLIALGKTIAEKLDVKFTKYTHHSVSMHVYIDRDIDDINKWGIYPGKN